jgi:hypothetical protein
VVITLISVLVYASTIVHSLAFEFCPYTTASSKLVKSYLKAWLLSPAESYFSLSWKRTIAYLRKRTEDIGNLLAPWITPAKAYIEPWSRKWRSYIAVTVAPNSAGDESSVASETVVSINDRPMDWITSHMLSWLLKNCHDSESQRIVVQSLAGADPWLPRLPLLENDVLSLLFQQLDHCFVYDYQKQSYCLKTPALSESACLYLRALQFLLSHYNRQGFLSFESPKRVVKNSWNKSIYNVHFGFACGVEDEW